MRATLALVFGFIATAASAEPRVVHVRNFGVDSPTCGEQLTPCRSIGHGIEIASTNDTVLVGPGVYGDLNRNGVIGETGEEGSGPGSRCLVCIGKTVTVLSERGAAYTTIDARNLLLTAVGMLGSPHPAVFGFADQGFTVLAGEGRGIELSVNSTAWGNRVVGGTEGIYTEWAGAAIYDNEVTDATGSGIRALRGLATISDNVIARNGEGIYAVNAIVMNNTIADNRGLGVTIVSPLREPTSIVRNLFIRNAGPGLALGPGPSASPDGSNSTVVDSNDFIGNDPVSGCGLYNGMGVGPLWAVNNFWAAAPDFGVTQQIACNGPAVSTIVDPPRLQPH